MLTVCLEYDTSLQSCEEAIKHHYPPISASANSASVGKYAIHLPVPSVSDKWDGKTFVLEQFQYATKALYLAE